MVSKWSQNGTQMLETWVVAVGFQGRRGGSKVGPWWVRGVRKASRVSSHGPRPQAAAPRAATSERKGCAAVARACDFNPPHTSGVAGVLDRSPDPNVFRMSIRIRMSSECQSGYVTFGYTGRCTGAPHPPWGCTMNFFPPFSCLFFWLEKSVEKVAEMMPEWSQNGAKINQKSVQKRRFEHVTKKPGKKNKSDEKMEPK